VQLWLKAVFYKIGIMYLSVTWRTQHLENVNSVVTLSQVSHEVVERQI